MEQPGLRCAQSRAWVGVQTRKRIAEAAAQLGYRPNAAARATQSGWFRSIALLLGTQESRSSLPEPLLYGIEESLQQRDPHLMVFRVSDEDLSDDRYHLFDNITFSGTVIPEPATLALAGCGLLMFARRRC